MERDLTKMVDLFSLIECASHVIGGCLDNIDDK